MPHTASNSAEPAAGLNALDVLVLYEDFESGVTGRQIAEFVAGKVQDHAEAAVTLWNVDLLDHPLLGTIATEQCVHTELLILSLASGDAFSIPLRAFLNRWLQHHTGGHAALVATFRMPGAATDFARRHLENATRRARVEFLTPAADIMCDQDNGVQAQFFRGY